MKLYVALTLFFPILGQTLNLRPNFTKLGHNKIVGGEDTTIEEHPYQASLLFFHMHICGGSILSTRWILSAAHCTTLDLGFSHTPIRGLSVRMGSNTLESGGEEVTVLRVYDHPSFLISQPRGLDYDVTLLYLARDISFSVAVQPVRLPEENEVYSPGTNATVTGWGLTNQWGTILPEILQKVVVPIISNQDCETMYNTWFIFDYITDRMLCAGYPEGQKDACDGDSGGPMIVNGTLVGAVSWGYGCALEMTPGVYVNVTTVRGWIREVSGI